MFGIHKKSLYINLGNYEVEYCKSANWPTKGTGN